MTFNRRRAGVLFTSSMMITAFLAVPVVPVAQAAPDPHGPAQAQWTIQEPVPAGFASWPELFQLQDRMNQAIAEIVAAGEASGDSGYASAIAAPEAREVVVYWNGAVPAAVRAVVDRISAGLPVKVLPAKHSQRELLAAQAKLAKHPEIVQVAPKADASGLSAERRKGAARTAQAQSTLEALGVEVTFGADSVGSIPFSTRQDDKPQWYAGARTDYCTTGFAVKEGSSSKLLYAGHCALNGELVYKDPQYGTSNPYMTIGHVEDRDFTRDVSLIGAVGGSYGRMWDGGNLSGFSKSVLGATFSNLGNWLCSSGSRSGVLCGLRVRETNVSRDGYFPLVMSERDDLLSGGGDGDSGGPLFELPSPDNGSVIAKGVLHGGHPSTRATCIGENWYGRYCSYRIYYADVTQSLAFLGAAICSPVCPVNRIDLGGDGLADITYRRASNQRLYTNAGNGHGSWGPINVELGSDSWQDTELLTAPGDFNSDGFNDLIFRRPSDSHLYMRRGNGDGGWDGNAVRIGDYWYDVQLLSSPGDFDGDGKPDLIFRRPSDTHLYMIPGNGFGGWKNQAVRFGDYWSDVDMLVASPDFSGDGKPDVLYRRKSNKNFYMVRGSGFGGFLTGQNEQIGIGWHDVDLIVAPGDFNGDGKADVLYRRASDQHFYMNAGNGSGGWSATNVHIGDNWANLDMIAGGSKVVP